MKINQDLRLNVDKIRENPKNTSIDGTKFQEYVQKQDQRLQVTQLNQLLTDIDRAGERLARSRTFKDLAKFKSLVKNFIKETVDFGMNLQQSHSWNQFGQGRSLKIVRTVDEKLIELSEGVLKKEEESIDILGKIGEIKGLLINLYT